MNYNDLRRWHESSLEEQRILWASLSNTDNSSSLPPKSDVALKDKEREISDYNNEDRDLQRAMRLSAEEAGLCRPSGHACVDKHDAPDTISVDEIRYVCSCCVPRRTYKSRVWYDKHVQRRRLQDHNHNRLASSASPHSAFVSSAHARSGRKRQLSALSNTVIASQSAPKRRRRNSSASSSTARRAYLEAVHAMSVDELKRQMASHGLSSGSRAMMRQTLERAYDALHSIEQPDLDLSSRTYIHCPYSEKDAAKALGAKWDPQRRQWFVPVGVPVAPFSRWIPLLQGGSSEIQQSDLHNLRKLVGMGFDGASAQRALRDAGNDLVSAIETLTSKNR